MVLKSFSFRWFFILILPRGIGHNERTEAWLAQLGLAIYNTNSTIAFAVYLYARIAGNMITKEKFLDWLVWLLIIVTIILFLLRIFGNSPTLDQLAVGVLVGFLLKLYAKVDKIDKKLFEFGYELRNHKHEEKK